MGIMEGHTVARFSSSSHLIYFTHYHAFWTPSLDTVGCSTY
jgi:hypothetical protein